MVGDRASYVLIQRRHCDVYYSHWGAVTTPQVVISGPEQTRAYIQGLEPRNYLLDTTWAEGGILLDATRKTLLFWGGKAITGRPYLRRLLLPALRVIWPEWQVSWASRGIVDFAEYPGVAKALGIDPASVINTTTDILRKPYSKETIQDPHQRPFVSAVVTVRWEDRQVSDYTFCWFPQGYITYGTALLTVLRDRQPEELPREDGTVDGNIIGGAYVDTITQTLWVWHGSTLDLPYLDVVRQAWPGWRLETHVDGLARQVALSGRDPALVRVPTDQAIAELTHELLDWDATAALIEILKPLLVHTDPATSTFAPGFFRFDRTLGTTVEDRERLLQLFAQVAQDADGADPPRQSHQS